MKANFSLGHLKVDILSWIGKTLAHREKGDKGYIILVSSTIELGLLEMGRGSPKVLLFYVLLTFFYLKRNSL